MYTCRREISEEIALETSVARRYHTEVDVNETSPPSGKKYVPSTIFYT